MRSNEPDARPDPALAVVILSTGAPPELAGTVCAVLAQRPGPEIVVVNSGGGDVYARLGQCCEEVRILDYPRPLSRGAARNRGLEATTAPFVAFLPTDHAPEPGWVAARLARHRAGAAIVTGSVIDRSAGGLAARAAFLAAFAHQLPGLPAGLAVREGASFARELLGDDPFREDLPFGEEADLMFRLSDAVPVRAPEVRTAWRGPRTLRGALRARYAEGRRHGHFMPHRHKGRLIGRSARRIARTFSRINAGLAPGASMYAWLHAPLICAMQLAFELGVREAGRLRSAMRRAVERGEHEDVLTACRAMWERTGDGEALVRMVDVLVSLGRSAEALDAIEVAARGELPERIRVIALARYHQARYDWTRLVALLDRHPGHMTREIALLHSYLTALSALGRPASALRAIDAYRGPARSAARFLRIEALLRCRRHADAWRIFEALDPVARARMPSHLLGSLFGAAYLSGGRARAEAFLDGIAPAGPAAPASALALGAVFYRARLESHAMLERGVDRIAAPAVPIEQQIAAVLASREDLHHPHLEEACARFDRLRCNHGAFHPDPSFVLFDAIRVARYIDDAVRMGRPLSLIRLGDGEGNLLPYRPHLASYQAVDYRTTCRAWWGDAADAGVGGGRLGQMLIAAIEGADIIGIPDLNRMRTTLGAGKNARGLVACIDFIVDRLEADPAWLDGRLVTSCHVHQSLAYWRLWDLLIPRMGTVSLITCHPRLADLLARRHGVDISAVHLIPAEAKYADAIEHAAHAPHYPDRFEELIDSLSVPRAGQVCLVAAGVLGKVYCDTIKRHGGIALDIGSVADEWAGYETRSLEETSNYLPPDEGASVIRALRPVFDLESGRFTTASPA